MCQELIHVLPIINLAHAVLFYYILLYIVFPQFQEIYTALTSQADYNVTLPMILSQWHKLYNSSCFEVWLSSLTGELGGAYWMNWMPSMTFDISQILLERFA